MDKTRPAGIFDAWGKILAKELSSEYGIPVEHRLRVLPWSRLQREIETGQIDIEISPVFMASKPGRQMITQPIGSVEFGIFALPEHNFESLDTPMVGVPKLTRDYYGTRFKDAYLLFPYDSFEQAVTLLLNKRLDGLLINRWALAFLLKRQNAPTIDMQQVASIRLPIQVFVSEKSPLSKDPGLISAVSRLAARQSLSNLIHNCIPRLLIGKVCRPEDEFPATRLVD